MSDFKRFMSPIVECRHAHVKNADVKYNKGGIYQIDLVMDRSSDEHRAFVKLLSDLRPDGAKNSVCKVSTEEPGIGIIKCKQSAVVNAGAGKVYEGFQPKVFDAQGKHITNIPLMGNGSKVRVEVEPRPYTLQGGGVRLRPVAIQIVDLVPYEAEPGSTPTPDSTSNFSPVEGSYVSNEKSQPEPSFPAINEELHDTVPPSVDDGFPPSVDDGFAPSAPAPVKPAAYEDF